MTGGTPRRTCIGCRAVRPQPELLRLRVESGTDPAVVVAGSGGRGAWVCAATSASCLGAARDRKALGRAFRRAVDPDSVDRLQSALSAGPSEG